MRAGRILDLESQPTLSDGTAGGIEDGTITLELCREVVDESVTVDEEAIADGVRLILEREHMLVEGAAGVAVAGFLNQRGRWEDKDVVIVLCGRNLGLDTLKSLL